MKEIVGESLGDAAPGDVVLADGFSRRTLPERQWVTRPAVPSQRSRGAAVATVGLLAAGGLAAAAGAVGRRRFTGSTAGRRRSAGGR